MEIREQTCTIYKRDTKGAVRVWQAQTGTDGTNWAWRTISGLEDGKQVESGWKLVEQKNVGKVNETSLQEQAVAEMTAEMNKKLERGYFKTLSSIDSFDKFKPMLAEKYEEVKFNFPVFAQPKLDGIRCIARHDGLWSRAGKEIVSVPHIQKALEEFFEANPDAILDGELYNHQLRDDFNKITSIVRKTKPEPEDFEESEKLAQYHIYDMASSSGTFSQRTKSLVEVNIWKHSCLQLVSTTFVETQEELDALYGSYLEEGYEGQMIRIDAKYECKRSKSLLKRKEFHTDEFKVIDVEEGKGNWAGHIKRFILELPSGTRFGAGVRGTQEVMKTMFESKEVPTWATLRYFTPTPDGIPRFPVVVDWGKGNRED